MPGRGYLLGSMLWKVYSIWFLIFAVLSLGLITPAVAGPGTEPLVGLESSISPPLPWRGILSV
jgi:hypothetical protein